MMIRMRSRMMPILLSVTSVVTIPIFGQANPPDAPSAQSGATVPTAAPSGQPATPAPLPPMPAPDPANFTASMPTKATVEAFLRASWGYDLNRIFQVQAIQKTQVD